MKITLDYSTHAFNVPITPVQINTAVCVSVCMCCKREMDTRHMPFGSALTPAANQSHGLCLVCLPEWAESNGISADKVEAIKRKLNKNNN